MVTLLDRSAVLVAFDVISRNGSLGTKPGCSSVERDACEINGSVDHQHPVNSMASSFRIDDLVVVPTVWGLIMVLGLFGNLTVAYVMIRYADRSATNYLIVNLALTDLAFTVAVVPLTMINYIMPDWALGRACCKFHIYTIYVLLFATCLTLTAMTVDRYFSICHPISSMPRRTPRAALVVNVISWAVSMTLSIPYAVYYDVVNDSFVDDQLPGEEYSVQSTSDDGEQTSTFATPVQQIRRCDETWPSIAAGRVAITFVVAVTYVLPMTLIVVCYTGVLRHLRRQQLQPPVASALAARSGSRDCNTSDQTVVVTQSDDIRFDPVFDDVEQAARSSTTMAPNPAAKRITSSGRSTVVAPVENCSVNVPRHVLASERRRRKAAKMVAVIVALFAVSWLPIHVFQLWFHFDDNFPRDHAPYMFKIIAHTLSYVNSSCVNPVVYCLLGDGFRKALGRWWPQMFAGHHNRSIAVVPDGERGRTRPVSGEDGEAASSRSSVNPQQRCSSTRHPSGSSTSGGGGPNDESASSSFLMAAVASSTPVAPKNIRLIRVVPKTIDEDDE